MFKLIKPLLIIIPFTIFLTACAGTPLKPGAERVKVTNLPAPKSCQLLGQVRSQDVNGFTQPYTSHEELINDENKVLRNKAISLGANLVVITDHETTYTGDNKQRVNRHLMVGNAYRCSADAIAKMPFTDSAEFSDVH